MTTLIILYAVQNQEGKWFRAKGYQGGGNTWVDSLETARIWTRIKPARATITYFANTYPSFGIPKLVKLFVTETEFVTEIERVEKIKNAKKLKKERQDVSQAKQKLEQAQKQYDSATKLLKKLRSENDKAG